MKRTNAVWMVVWMVSMVTVAAQGGYIAPGSITATASSDHADWGAGYAPSGSIDTVGMDVPTLIHWADASNYWHSDSGNQGAGTSATGVACQQWVKYEFDAVYELDEMLIWNGAMNVYNRSTKDIVISYSLDGTNWTPIFTGQLADTTDIEMNGRTYSDVIDFGGISAKFVEMDLISQWNTGDGYYLMDEVLFSLVVPEPATLVLLSLGALLLGKKK